MIFVDANQSRAYVLFVAAKRREPEEDSGMTSTTYAASLIRESVDTDSIVTVTSGDCYSAGCEFDALLGALLVECEDDVEANGTREFWGTTEGGNEWRVHVEGVAP